MFSEKEKSTLHKSFIAAIILTASTLVSLIAETAFMSGWFDKTFTELIFRSFIGCIMIVSVYFYLKGYKTLANKASTNSLRTTSIIYFVIEIIVVLGSIFLVLIDKRQSMLLIVLGSLNLAIFGIAELLLGVGIQKLKDSFGSFAQIIGIVKMINGICLILVVLSPISLIITLPLLICEVVFLYQINDKY